MHAATADRIAGTPSGKRVQFEQRRVTVDEQLDPLPHEHLSPLAVAVDVALATGHDRTLLLGEHLVEQRLHRLAVGPVRR